MIFDELFAITCTHSYFANGQCSDVQIIPTTQCNTLLRQYKILFKQTDSSSYTLLLQQSNNKVKVPAAPLTFYICITGNQFYNYTNYPAAASAAAETNAGDNGNTLLFTGVDADKGASFVITTAAKPSPFAYQNLNLFGIISITVPKVYRNYKLTLAAATTKWRYYIVAGKSVKNVVVKEKSLTGEDTGALTFKDITGTVKTDAAYLSLQTAFPDASVFVNESDIGIPMMQRTGKIIQC